MHPSNAHLPAPALELREDTPTSEVFGDVYFSREGGVAETDHVFLKGNGLPGRWMEGAAPDTAGSLPWQAAQPQRTYGVNAWYLDGFAPAKNPDMWQPELFAMMAAASAPCATVATFTAAGAVKRGLEAAGFAVTKTAGFGRKRDMITARLEGSADGAGGLVEGQGSSRPSEGGRGECPFLSTHCFTVAELGFGTGLNFLTTLKRFRETAAEGATLHYHAVEKYPFTPEVLARLLDLQPALAAEAAELLAQYPLRLPGPHRLEFGRVTLDLWFGDVVEWLEHLVGAGKVLPAAANAARARAAHAIIIGAGIAGASLARALAVRGARVTVLERAQVAGGASGNRAGVLFPPLTKRWLPSTAFYFTALDHALRRLHAWRAEGLDFGFASPGMLRLPRTEQEEIQLAQVQEMLGLDPSIVRSVSREEACDIAGTSLPTGAAYFAQGTWVTPARLCRALLQHKNILLREGVEVAGCSKIANGWAVTCADGSMLEADVLCIASGADGAALLAPYGLKVQAVGGQVSEFAAADVAAPLRSILCRKGYIIPPMETSEPLSAGASEAKGTRPPSGMPYLTGATYHREELLTVTEERHAENMAELEALLPGWFTGRVTGGRSSMRATTPDRLPYIGRLEEGLYVSAGHGSRGMLSGPLAAEMIASMICGEAPPVMREQAAIVSPMRFTKG